MRTVTEYAKACNLFPAQVWVMIKKGQLKTTKALGINGKCKKLITYVLDEPQEHENTSKGAVYNYLKHDRRPERSVDYGISISQSYRRVLYDT